jgi:hypothetical protein
VAGQFEFNRPEKAVVVLADDVHSFQYRRK